MKFLCCNCLLLTFSWTGYVNVPALLKLITDLDFDGTIFMQDTGHVLFDAHGCGAERREVLDQQIKSGERSFKEVSEEMWGSLNVCTTLLSWPGTKC